MPSDEDAIAIDNTDTNIAAVSANNDTIELDGTVSAPLNALAPSIPEPDPIAATVDNIDPAHTLASTSNSSLTAGAASAGAASAACPVHISLVSFANLHRQIEQLRYSAAARAAAEAQAAAFEQSDNAASFMDDALANDHVDLTDCVLSIQVADQPRESAPDSSRSVTRSSAASESASSSSQASIEMDTSVSTSSSPPPHRDHDQQPPAPRSLRECTTVADLLAFCNAPNHAEHARAFEAAGVSALEDLPFLLDADFERLLPPLGARRRVQAMLRFYYQAQARVIEDHA